MTPKIVFAGPVGAGKSTAIRSISDTEPVSTEVPWLGDDLPDKQTTTVALDFSTVQIDEDQSLEVFGLPGQDHLAFMRPILLTGALGVVLLLSAIEEDVVASCTSWWSSMTEQDPEMPVVIGISHTDHRPDFDLGAIRQALPAERGRVPILTFDPRDREQTRQLVRVLLTLLLQRDLAR